MKKHTLNNTQKHFIEQIKQTDNLDEVKKVLRDLIVYGIDEIIEEKMSCSADELAKKIEKGIWGTA